MHAETVAAVEEKLLAMSGIARGLYEKNVWIWMTDSNQSIRRGENVEQYEIFPDGLSKHGHSLSVITPQVHLYQATRVNILLFFSFSSSFSLFLFLIPCCRLSC